MDLGLAGKKAVVTGSSRGLGFAIAQLLAKEGVRVAINGRDEAALQEAARKIVESTGQAAYPMVGNVVEPGVADKLVDEAADRLGGIDILITNSGGPPSGKFDSFDDADWQNAVELSFLSHVRLIRAALPYLRSSSAASVLTLTSYSVKQPIPNLVLSNSIRAATTGLTKSLALELGCEGIRFNSILPGWTTTERVKELLTHRAEANKTSFEAEMTKQTNEIAMGRMAEPIEIARAAVFMVSPAASYITGVMLNVDGGTVKGF